MRIRPQEGYQIEALSSSADIVIGGGAAGVGKTFVLLLEPVRHFTKPSFGGVIFRRTSPMIKAQGGLWDASTKLYNLIQGADPKKTQLTWDFTSGAKLKFSHLEYEKNKYDWQGSEIPYIGFDELTHFTKSMFFYLLSRNRAVGGIKPYVRATCNPDPDSWVRLFIDWWIGEDGFPIPERSGVIRYFMRDNDNYIWGATRKEVLEKGSHIIQPMLDEAEKKGLILNPNDFIKSLTFISGSIYDNKELLKSNPEYLGNLNAQSKSEKSRLLDGNWNEKVSDEDVFGYKAFKSIFTNKYVEEREKYSEKRITSDIAMKGSDKMVIFCWQGKMLIDFEVLPKTKGNEVVDAMRRMAYKHGVSEHNILFDNDGVGSFVDGFIEDAVEFNNGARALNGEQYKNLKSQCYIRCGDAVSRGDYYIPEEIANRNYSDNVTLREQLMTERKAIKRAKPDHDGKLAVIPKQEMKVYLEGRSPDLMDAFMENEYWELAGEAPEVDYM